MRKQPGTLKLHVPLNMFICCIVGFTSQPVESLVGPVRAKHHRQQVARSTCNTTVTSAAACPTVSWRHPARRAAAAAARHQSTTMPFSALRKMPPGQTSRKRQYRTLKIDSYVLLVS